MSIASEITRINTNIENAYTSVSNKGGTLPATQNSNNLATAITSIPSGGATLQTKSVTITTNGNTSVTPDTGYDGLDSVNITTSVSGEGTEKKDVNFYDYDGTLVDSYTKTDFLALSNMPNNPSHTGLTAQGWNWTLSDAKTYVTTYGKLNIGQTYTTSSGLSEFDIELTNSTGLSVTLNMNGTKNWGDGTTDTNNTHTYSSIGKYTITCNGTQITATQGSGLFGQYSSSLNYYVKNVRLSNITTIPAYSFQYCRSLATITIPNESTSIGMNTFFHCYSLNSVVISKNITSIGASLFFYCVCLTTVIFPNGLTNLGSNTFNFCYSLKNITIPNSVTTIEQRTFYYCYSLKDIIIPNSVEIINANSFTFCYILLLYDFTKFSSVPTLNNANAFNGINGICKIVVPNNLYDTWVSASNWSNFASNIIKESDYNA